MVVIRLARTGKKKQAFYRVVVADSKRAVTAKFISILGWYNPHTKELNIKEEQVAEWLGKGAQPSNTVAVLFKKNGIKLPDWVNVKEKVKKSKNEVEEKPAAEPKAEVKEEAPAEAPEKESETGAEALAEEKAEEAAPEADAEVSAE